MSRSQEKAMVIPFFATRDSLTLNGFLQDKPLIRILPYCSEKVQEDEEEEALPVEEWSIVVPPDNAPYHKSMLGSYWMAVRGIRNGTTPNLHP